MNINFTYGSRKRRISDPQKIAFQVTVAYCKYHAIYKIGNHVIHFAANYLHIMLHTD